MDMHTSMHGVSYNTFCQMNRICELVIRLSDMSLCVRKLTILVPTRCDTNRAVQSQKMVRGLKFWIKIVEELYYPCSENKGADQLRSYCEADLRLCFRLCRLLDFSRGGSYNLAINSCNTALRGCVNI